MWLYCQSGSFVSVLSLDNIAFRKVPIGTLRNETVIIRSETLCLEKEAACRRLFRLQLGSVWLYCRSGSLVSVLFIDIIAFRKVPIGTLRNETVTSVKIGTFRGTCV